MGTADIVVWGVLLSGPTVGIVLPLLLRVRRRWYFRRRPRVPFQDWAGCLGISSMRSALVCEKVLNAFGRVFGVDPAQFRPEDSFDREFAWAPPWVGLSNRELDEVLDEVARILWEEGVKSWTRFKPSKRTLGDLLLHVDSVLAESQSHT